MNVRTGIGRYIESLYSVMERQYSDLFEFSYFNGVNLSPSLPSRAKDADRASWMASFFWKLPSSLSYLIRLVLLCIRDLRMLRYSGKFDVYHETALFPFRVSENVATLSTVHDLSLDKCPQFHPAERVMYFRKFFYDRIRKSDAFLAVSDFTRRELLSVSDVRAEQVLVTPLACDKRIFHAQKQEKIEAVMKELGIVGEYFLFVGTNDPRKNTALLAQAVQSGSITTQVVIAGWSGWGGDIPDGILNVGYVSDDTLACLYSGATALIFPSFYEGFGLPVLEAMTCGCPVILTREASLPEVAGDAGCYLSTPDALDELISWMQRFETDAKFRQEMSDAALEQSRLFSWEETARLTKEALLAVHEAKNR
nr:glycosyltransferase family 1 protein [uncultured Pseudodesulfovibrio sp.]